MSMERACMLLSGGMDSTAALDWSQQSFVDVRAIGFDYGQPMRDAELFAAGRLARSRGVPFEVIALADTMHSGLLAGVPKHSDGPMLSRAFVPGRNLIFLSIALGRASQWWPRLPFGIVIGACAEDAAGFPDCGEDFLRAAGAAMSAAVALDVRVHAPFIHTTKTGILRRAVSAGEPQVQELQRSWSCYAGRGPCSECSACVLRARAFNELGLPDLCRAPELTGGDVYRDRMLGA